ncbi:MAG: tRNA (adenosine(37)-N6)-threonylcarbamoyltransferase complex ATPase subunit type 1 TsaE [Syntrophaceae bacterium]|jgi:tRNA threonylcarbamoyladenosine biosynthesis protein TsaE|nr:tRNA (adenosine(37)-N6)-threonylcarbamoyltransferase complex ATPase subunit type 1 TsaE [Syntrophaceae bacterium]
MKNKNALVKIQSENADQTFAVGLAIGQRATDGDVFALCGELGAGKTCFTGGLARGLGIGPEYAITSPTFTLLNEYPGRCRFFHFDVYRLNQTGDLDDLGYDEYISGKGVTAIEWAEKIAEALPPETIWISIVYVHENERIIRIEGPQDRVRHLVRDLNRED